MYHKALISHSFESHLYGFSPVWIRRWHRNRSLIGNSLLQKWQLYVSSGWCLLSMWFRRPPLWVNLASQISQRYGRSPVCVLRCFFKLYQGLNCFSQYSQKYTRPLFRPPILLVIFSFNFDPFILFYYLIISFHQEWNRLQLLLTFSFMHYNCV